VGSSGSAEEEAAALAVEEEEEFRVLPEEEAEEEEVRAVAALEELEEGLVKMPFLTLPSSFFLLLPFCLVGLLEEDEKDSCAPTGEEAVPAVSTRGGEEENEPLPPN